MTATGDVAMLAAVTLDLSKVRAYTETRANLPGPNLQVLVIEDGAVRIELFGGAPIADAARRGAQRIHSAVWTYAGLETAPLRMVPDA